MIQCLVIWLISWINKHWQCVVFSEYGINMVVGDGINTIWQTFNVWIEWYLTWIPNLRWNLNDVHHVNSNWFMVIVEYLVRFWASAIQLWRWREVNESCFTLHWFPPEVYHLFALSFAWKYVVVVSWGFWALKLYWWLDNDPWLSLLWLFKQVRHVWVFWTPLTSNVLLYSDNFGCCLYYVFMLYVCFKRDSVLCLDIYKLVNDYEWMRNRIIFWVLDISGIYNLGLHGKHINMDGFFF